MELRNIYILGRAMSECDRLKYSGIKYVHMRRVKQKYVNIIKVASDFKSMYIGSAASKVQGYVTVWNPT
jgi:hypothetical protein